MRVGTFHGLAHRLLRSHWQEAGLPEDFHILDAEDQLRLIKRINRSLRIDEEKWPAKQCQWYINSQKDEGLRAKKTIAIQTANGSLVACSAKWEATYLHRG